jgi:hypothetical protein
MNQPITEPTLYGSMSLILYQSSEDPRCPEDHSYKTRTIKTIHFPAESVETVAL